MLGKFFRLREEGTTYSREILAGVTTFLTMSYILVVQPTVLSKDFSGAPTGIEPGAVLLATCLSSAFATAVMAIYARLPVALAPGMGPNFFFVSVVMTLSAQGAADTPWHGAMAIVLLSGIAFFLLSVLGFRRIVLDVMSPSLRCAIAVGIGMFIAFIGLRNGGVVVAAPSLVALNAAELWSVDSAIFWGGLATTLVLKMRRVPGSILIGIAVSAAAAFACGKISFDDVIGLPQFHESSVLKFDFGAVWSLTGLSFVAVFLFMDIFDSTGTMIGVAHQAGLLQDGRLPRMRQAMLADSVGTIFGACVGTSTVTSYIESAAGVEQGGRTGLMALTVSVMFLVAILFSPLIVALGGYAPIAAPALVVVGAMMFRSVSSIDWSDETEAIPSFLVILGIPIFFSIADGIALGLIAWPILKIARGRSTDVSIPAYAIAFILLAYFLAIRVHI